ncbi:MAG: hypothetical protein J6V69_03385, partial [Clostridia bacterium]|nr:hypothetical protein [Clostridia bacterium]
TPVTLKAGSNKIRLFNPIGNRADSAMLQYQNMGKQLRLDTQKVAKDTNSTEKPIVFSICEWDLIDRISGEQRQATFGALPPIFALLGLG